MSKSLDPDPDKCSVNPDLGSNCLQSSADKKKVAASKERVNKTVLKYFYST